MCDHPLSRNNERLLYFGFASCATGRHQPACEYHYCQNESDSLHWFLRLLILVVRYSTAVSSSSLPVAKRSTLSCFASIRSECPWRIRSAAMRPDAGECMTPWPLKPFTKYKPSTFGDGPMTA